MVLKVMKLEALACFGELKQQFDCITYKKAGLQVTLEVVLF